MAGDLQTLIEFGFSDAKAKRALKQTKNAGLQPALDWLEKHADDPEPTGAEQEDESQKEMDDDEIEKGASAADLVAKSLKCSVCGKTFRNNATASYHGDKTGHDQFEESTEEIKPLTEEEKKTKLEELRSKAVQRKAEKEKVDMVEKKANEGIRRKGGQDLGAIREEMKVREMVKASEQAKRDKIIEAQAKAKVKLEIEADKKARAEKAAREKAIRAGNLPIIPSSGPSVPVPSSAGVKKTYDEARLQIRLPESLGKPPLTRTMKSDKTLAELANWISDQSGIPVEEIKISSQFPRKTFTNSDMNSTLQELGLVPSSSLMVTL